ncbi:MAG TPA: hypothetical protein VFV63_05755 [Ilumatobacteraceae bacterium]|nr:hypothetical protein [Ilumatobacteraceae bacterium]
MTDLAEPDATTSAADEQLRRIQQLQRKRGVGTGAQTTSSTTPARETPTERVRSTARRRSRPHPAIGARVGAAGLGLVTMFGLVAGMGFAQSSTASGAPAPVVAAPAEVIVVIHRTPASTISPTDATTSTAAASSAPLSTAAAPTAAAPIALTARPVVRAAPAQSNAAPAARTNGSR